MILLCGIPTEPPVAMVTEALEKLGASFRVFNQRRFAEMHLVYEVANGAVDGWLEMDGRESPWPPSPESTCG